MKFTNGPKLSDNEISIDNNKLDNDLISEKNADKDQIHSHSDQYSFGEKDGKVEVPLFSILCMEKFVSVLSDKE